MPAGRAADAAIDLTPGVPDLAAFPRAAWLRSERAALEDLPSGGLGYADPAGVPVFVGDVKGDVSGKFRSELFGESLLKVGHRPCRLLMLGAMTSQESEESSVFFLTAFSAFAFFGFGAGTSRSVTRIKLDMSSASSRCSSMTR